MRIPKFIPLGLASLGLCLLLLSCVQRGEFRTFQGEVRRGLDLQGQRIRTLQDELRRISNRLDALEKDRDAIREQMAKLMGEDLVVMQQEMATLRNEVETLTHRQTGGLEELKRTQERLDQRVKLLEQRLLESPPAGGVPGATALPGAPPPQEAPKVEDLYKEARYAFESGEYERARKGFQDLLARQPDSRLAGNAQFWIGECYFREGNYKQAILEYEKVVSQYPQSTKVPSALLKQGMAFEKLGDAETARFLYRKITKEHPESDQARIAEHRLKQLP